MKCNNCGTELAPEDKFCGGCGAPRPQLSPRFVEAASRFRTLRARYRAGELEDAAYDAELRQLVVEDSAGGYWMLGADSGDWYWYDGQQWVQRNPPPAAETAGAPASLDGSADSSLPAEAVAVVSPPVACALAWMSASISLWSSAPSDPPEPLPSGGDGSLVGASKGVEGIWKARLAVRGEALLQQQVAIFGSQDTIFARTQEPLCGLIDFHGGNRIGGAGHVQEDILCVVDGGKKVGFFPVGQVRVEARLSRERRVRWD